MTWEMEKTRVGFLLGGFHSIPHTLVFWSMFLEYYNIKVKPCGDGGGDDDDGHTFSFYAR